MGTEYVQFNQGINGIRVFKPFYRVIPVNIVNWIKMLLRRLTDAELV